MVNNNINSSVERQNETIKHTYFKKHHGSQASREC